MQNQQQNREAAIESHRRLLEAEEAAHRKRIALLESEHKKNLAALDGSKEDGAPSKPAQTALCWSCERVLSKSCFSQAQFRRAKSISEDPSKRARCKQCVSASFNHAPSFGGTQKGRQKLHEQSIFEQMAGSSGKKKTARAPASSTSNAESLLDHGAEAFSMTGDVTRKNVKDLTGAKLRPRNWGFTTYLDRLFAMRCFLDMMELRVFPDAKDITESMGALQAATVHFFNDTSSIDGQKVTPGNGCWKFDDVLCLVIGDGNTPRTATLVSFLTQWTSVSIDPELRDEWVGSSPKGVHRLYGVRDTFEPPRWLCDSLVSQKCV